MTGEAPRAERLSFTGLRVAIAAVVVVGLVFLGNAIDDGADSGADSVWPVVRAAEDSCGLVAKPSPLSGVVRFSGICDLEKPPELIRLTQPKPRQGGATASATLIAGHSVLDAPGEAVGTVFRGVRKVGKCVVDPGKERTISCRPLTRASFPRLFRLRATVTVEPAGCGPFWSLVASFRPEVNQARKAAPVIWRGCGIKRER